MLHPRRVPKLDSANGDVLNEMRPVSWQAQHFRGRHNICVAGAAVILHDVAESDEKENEGRTNAGPAARSKGSFQRRWAAGNGDCLLARQLVPFGWDLLFETRSF